MFKKTAFLSLAALAAVLTFGCGGGGGDDGDGGQLSASEEGEVLAWFTELSVAGQAISNTADNSSPNSSVGINDMIEQLEAIGDNQPPRVGNDEVNQALRDFHGGIIIAMDSLKTIAEMMNNPANMAQMAQRGPELQANMERAEAQMRTAAQTLQRVFVVDFGDNEQAMAQLREAFGGFDIPTSGMDSGGAAAPGAAEPGKS